MPLKCVSDLFSTDQIIILYTNFNKYKTSKQMNYNIKFINYCIYFLTDIKNEEKYLNDLDENVSDKIKSSCAYCILLLKKNIDLLDVFDKEYESIMPEYKAKLFKNVLDEQYNYFLSS
jgi:hypothetical protein